MNQTQWSEEMTTELAKFNELKAAPHRVAEIVGRMYTRPSSEWTANEVALINAIFEVYGSHTDGDRNA